MISPKWVNNLRLINHQCNRYEDSEPEEQGDGSDDDEEEEEDEEDDEEEEEEAPPPPKKSKPTPASKKEQPATKKRKTGPTSADVVPQNGKGKVAPQDDGLSDEADSADEENGTSGPATKVKQAKVGKAPQESELEVDEAIGADEDDED
ncbi:hypothetical protein BGZ60DRAFT_182801 [Tricladium varicosporioides]|nr:hypothetical protein BGZ60DRAFT_182801 [Hymenoscyphus varicosporioides]